MKKDIYDSNRQKQQRQNVYRIDSKECDTGEKDNWLYKNDDCECSDDVEGDGDILIYTCDSDDSKLT